jgi:hypothetical protein
MRLETNKLQQESRDSVSAAITAPIRRACAISGLSRSSLYRAAAAGRIRLLKHGRSSLVDMASLRAFIAGLPEAVIRQTPALAHQNANLQK